jgi:hypothetical protein
VSGVRNLRFEIVSSSPLAEPAERHICRTQPTQIPKPRSELADSAADYKTRISLSLADAFAAALANQKKAEPVTGDPESKPLEKEIKINWLKS